MVQVRRYNVGRLVTKQRLGLSWLFSEHLIDRAQEAFCRKRFGKKTRYVQALKFGGLICVQETAHADHLYFRIYFS